jgi:hypothetical protein
MSKAIGKTTPTNETSNEALLLEQRKVKALEKIAASVDALTIWFVEINKDEWSDRIQYYLSEFHNVVKPEDPTING